MSLKHIIAAGCILTSSLLQAQTNVQELDFSVLEKNITQSKTLSGLPSGTSIAVVKGDKIVYQGHFGLADIANNIKVTGDTPFYIASTTKPFTALNMLLDIEHNKLQPSVSLATMFPSLDIPDIDESEIDLRELMTHTSSINNLPLVLATAYSGIHDRDSLENLVIHESSKAQHAVGEFKYTNVGYNIYSVFSDRYFNQPWQERLETQIFKPLSMSSTSAQRSFFRAHNIDIAKPYSLLVRSLPEALYLEKSDQTMHAAGGMMSTSNDLAKFVIAQLNQGSDGKKTIFPASVIDASQQQQVTTQAKYLDFDRDGYAWGWYTGNYKEQRMLHHFGGFAGTHAHISFIPEKQVGLIVLNNEDFLSARMTSIIADFIYGKLLGDTNIEQRVIERFAELNAKLGDLDKMLNTQEQKIQSRVMNLSLPREAYQGEYTHPQLGSIEILVNPDSQMTLRWGAMHSVALGFDKEDHIRVTLDPTSGNVLRFKVSDRVDTLIYEGIEFKKILKTL